MDYKTIIGGLSFDEVFKAQGSKKSIRAHKSADSNTGSKRDNIKAQIHWKEVPEKADDRKAIKQSFPALRILTSRGYRWHYIHDTMLKLRSEEMKPAKQTDEESLGARKKAVNTMIHDLGSGVFQKRYNKNAELTLDQQTHLEILKHKVKAENDAYLKQHPEIGIMIKLIYAALFKHQPKKPKRFVADYVHHLNKHREELVIKDVDIPFDRPVIPEEISSEEAERSIIKEYAQQIVESCLNTAAQGASHFNVVGIINSMLNRVSGSEEKLSVESVISNAEIAVSEVLSSLLSAAVTKRTSAELVVDEILDVILSNALPFIHKGSKEFEEMRESVENFIHDLVEQLADQADNQITLKEILKEPVRRKGPMSMSDSAIKSILRTNTSLYSDEEELSKTKSKVQFS